MLKLVLIVIAVAIAGVLIAAYFKPDNFSIQRSTVIHAQPEKVYALLDDFHCWSIWSPWEKLDPQLQRNYSGPQKGVGAEYHWKGNKKVGEGHMQILDAEAPSKVRVQLDFIAPFAAHNFAEFTLTPVAEGTQVTWTMYGPSPFISKLMTTFISMEKMVGPDFEKGLANLKAAAEAQP